ncbi:D-ribose pyranase [Comamonas piscis]|uniref:D-ribose pyranase n=1 Tax=Comamonas piscis TaxID=1562974 RepID=A0A7G5EC24_9BURK|nr:D-ribose pyranase [Comamonas piscis]QMV71549.1 D-ribose pyranase [Comamonas piscis]WSO34262.1 D-ribose pyranase [Comamonas piscis]
MKRAALLNIELSQIIAGMGHGDLLVIGDAGLPVPPGVRRVDLAVARGVPTLDQVLQAILSELQVESAVVADECLDGQQLPTWYQQRQADGLPSAPQCVSHEAFKALSRQAVAVVRTGECTPYANIALRSGVAF